MKTICVEDIQVQISKKNIKSLRLSVHPPNGQVKLSMPNNISEKRAKDFIYTKLGWIREQRDKMGKLPKAEVKKYETGEAHFFLGKEYRLGLKEVQTKQRVEIQDDKLLLYIKKDQTRENIEKLLKEWYRKQLKELIPAYIAKWEPVLGVEVKDWGIKDMKTRWGSCNINDQRIWLNLKLAKKDEKYLEYIIVHEMTHLLERLHNDKFNNLMTKFIPNWKVLKKGLKSY